MGSETFIILFFLSLAAADSLSSSFFFVALRLLNTKSSSVFATSVFRVYHKIWLLPRICILNCCFNIFGGDRESLNLSVKLQANMANLEIIFID
jgi:hypothetical protein